MKAGVHFRQILLQMEVLCVFMLLLVLETGEIAQSIKWLVAGWTSRVQVPLHPDQLWGPPSLLPSGYWQLTHLPLELRSRMHEALPPCPIHLNDALLRPQSNFILMLFSTDISTAEVT